MIPLRLALKNFLCYRDNAPTLDLTGIHVACLCGANGHGKSALLDAITWCLWGKARGKTQDDLVSYGADESRVELEFLARDTCYRVIRSHVRGGARRRQGVTDLQLQVMGAQDAEPITGNSVRETQARIEQLVGLDYDTFINSAFLLQGRADEFTNKTAADRKAVLAKILGLETYDRLQELAREKLAETKAEADRVEGELGRMGHEVEEIGDPSQELAEVGSYLDKVNQHLEAQRQEVGALRGRVNELERQRSQQLELQGRLDTLRLDMERLESAARAIQGRIQQYQSLIQQTETIRQGVARLEQARQRFNALEEARRLFYQLSEEKGRLVRLVESQQARLEEQVKHLQRQEADLTPKAGAEATLLAQQEEERRRSEGMAGEEQEIASQRERLQALAVSIGEAQTTAERYRLEGQELRAKLDLLNRTDHQEAACPLCQTPLGVDGCQRLAATYAADIEEKRSLYRQNHARLRQLEAEKADLDQSLPRREQALSRAQRESQLKLRDLERQIQESRQAQQDLAQTSAQLASVRASLASGEFAAAEHSRLRELEQSILALEYDEQARQESYAETEALRHFEEQQRQLSQAVAHLPAEEESLGDTQDMLQRRREESDQLAQEHQAVETAIQELPQCQARLEEAEAAHVELERERDNTISRRVLLENAVTRLERLGREIDASSTRLESLYEEQGIYQELVTAFGRQGVQAMLIETVVPRLEQEANNLLGRMTDNRMHVKLETQRERRTGRGDPIETLEIYVSDELGPRSYDMYSGGEAFRVNLALRIALSKVLAQRMGAPLPTLFIDEGFGTQDAAGRERILDVIGSIQGEFEKIIVITHLDDLKDMFPVRIEVQKDGNGSTFWLS